MQRVKKRIVKRRSERGFVAVFTADLIKAGFVLFLLHVFVIQFSVVRGSSMMPNIRDGDRLLVDRLSYSMMDIDRFDVVILRCPRDVRVDYVKRIVGMPGDSIEIRRNGVFVNAKLLPEPFPFVHDRNDAGSWRVPDGSYFVLGDNRPISSDSREGWFVPRSAIKGKVRACVWPVSRVRLF